MDYKKYGKGTWIVTIILALVSIVFDVLILAGVVMKGNEMMKQSSMFTLVIAAYILVASIRNLVLRIKYDKEQNQE